MTASPLVTIIIPVYNRKELLLETLKSVVSQTYENWECIIVDDHSTDGTYGYVRDFFKDEGRIVVYRRPLAYPKGAPSCRNFGFEKSAGEYVQFFDSDDLMKDNMIERKVLSLNSNPDVDFVVGKMGSFFDNISTSTEDEYCVTSAHPATDMLKGKIKFYTPGPMYRRRSLDRARVLFDTRLQRNQEGELHARLLLSGFKYKELGDYLCFRRLHKDSIKSKSDRLGKVAVRRQKVMMYVYLNENTDYNYSREILNSKRSYFLKSFFLFLMNFDIKSAFLLVRLVAISLKS